MSTGVISKILFVVGYPTAVVCITRLVPIFRQRRTRWFAAHELGTAAIVAGWALEHNAQAVAINGTWLVGVGVAWLASRARRRSA